MKGIKTILGVLAAASLLVSFSASAQENGNRDENGKVVRGAYETNKFFDNWFIGVGAGLNGVLPNVWEDFEINPLAVDVNVGKWITPTVGVRGGWKGITNSYEQVGDFDQHYFHADALWNLSNTFGGYKETRFWDIIPYASFGGLLLKPENGSKDWDYAGGAGIINDFRLGKHVDLFVDIAAIVTKGNNHVGDGGKFFTLPSATAGLIFNLGKTGFDRHSSVIPVVIPPKFTDAEYEALKNRVAQLEKENADLKKQIEALKNAKPDTVYVNVPSEVASESTSFFDLGSAVLSTREKAHLDFFIENVIKTAPADKVFEIVGSADKATGSAAGNQKLSEQRANAVKAYLVKNGVDESKLAVKALGGVDTFKPVANNRVVTIK